MTIMTNMFEYINRRKKAYNLPSFIAFSMLLTIITALIYKKFFLNNIFFFNLTGSWLLAKIIFFYGFLFHLLFSAWDAKTNISLLNLIIPFEFAVAITYFSEHKSAVLISAGVFLVSVILLTVSLTVRKFADNDKKFREIIRRLKASVFVSKFIFIVCFIPIVILAFVTAVIEPAIKDFEFREYQDVSLTIEEHYQALAPLGAHEDEEKWQALDATRKTELLQLLLDMDAKRLGLPYRVSLETTEVSDTNLGGVYDDAKKTITIYNLSEKTGQECLYVLFHELFHSAQHCYVEVYNTYVPEKFKICISSMMHGITIKISTTMLVREVTSLDIFFKKLNLMPRTMLKMLSCTMPQKFSGITTDMSEERESKPMKIVITSYYGSIVISNTEKR